MPTHDLPAAGKTRHPNDGLLDSLQRWRDADRAAEPESVIPGLRVIEAHRATIERAKAALMLRYELDPLPAFAVLVHWSRLTHTPVHTLAETLVHGLRNADPWTVIRDRQLIRWLEEQLLKADPMTSSGSDRGRRTGQGPVPMRLRTLDSCAEQGGCRDTAHAAECPCTTRPPTLPATSAGSTDLEVNQDEKKDTTRQRVARTLRYLASHYLADADGPDRDHVNQNLARTNAATASDLLRERRIERDDVEAYLQAQRPTGTGSQPTPDRHRAEAG